MDKPVVPMPDAVGIERLRALLVSYASKFDQLHRDIADDFRDAASLLQTAERVEALEEALRPFAEQQTIDEILHDPEPREWANGSIDHRIKMIGERKRKHDANVLRARAALAPASGDGEAG